MFSNKLQLYIHAKENGEDWQPTPPPENTPKHSFQDKKNQKAESANLKAKSHHHHLPSLNDLEIFCAFPFSFENQAWSYQRQAPCNHGFLFNFWASTILTTFDG
jgi:hypothetical protein